MIAGLVGLFPVAFGAGAVALVQLRERPGAGRGLAIGGMVAAACWSVLAALVVVGLTFGPGAGPGPSLAGRVAELGSTTPGTCLDPVEAVAACTEAHAGEVYRVEVLEQEEAWPGDDLAVRADDLCFEAFEDYVGAPYEDSAYDYAAYAPAEADWERGERRLACVVVSYEDDVLTGRVAGSGR